MAYRSISEICVKDEFVQVCIDFPYLHKAHIYGRRKREY